MLTVTKKFSFCYAHHLPGYKGDCARLHGHNSNVEVEFKMTPEMPHVYDGMVIDFKDIKRRVQPIIDRLDHQDINDILHPNNPTAENIAKWIAAEIICTAIGDGLVRVQVSETDDSFATWRAE